MSDDDSAWMDMMDAFPLFEEDEDDGPVFQHTAHGRTRKNLGQKPPEPRSSNCDLVGLANLGATCYMNSLIQAMYFTPGFRDQLFQLTYSDLRVPEDGNLLSPTARRIPIELQQLLAEMTLLDQSSVTTKRLVDAFGWTESDMREQHDVQELNRLLCDAIDRSLVGTAGDGLVPSLYNGVFVWTTQCFKCCDNPSVSTRVEPFQDIQQSVVDVASLAKVLDTSFVKPERFTGDNKLRCGNCNELAEGERTCRLGGPLPAVLTISLNRYTWDLRTGERKKVNSRFEFPETLKVRQYCTEDLAAELDDESEQYELYSVVLHSGGAGGGHYTALVRDIRSEGEWVQPSSEGNNDAASDGGWVKVGKGSDIAEEDNSTMPGKWFYMNDQRVSCASEDDLLKSFEGSASAYMLFYVRRSHVDRIVQSPLQLPPEVLLKIDDGNRDVAQKRAEYEDKVNQISVIPIFPQDIRSDGLVVCSRDESVGSNRDADKDTMVLSIDKRLPLSELEAQLSQDFTESVAGLTSSTGLCFNAVFRLPLSHPTWYVGNYLGQSNATGADTTIEDSGFIDGLEFLVWDGSSIHGNSIRTVTTDEERPLLVRVTLYGVLSEDDFDDGHSFDVILPPTAVVQDVCDYVACKPETTAWALGNRMIAWKSYKEHSQLDLNDTVKTMCGTRAECEIVLFRNHAVADSRIAELLDASGLSEIVSIVAETNNGVLNVEYNKYKLGDSVAALKAAIVKRMDPMPVLHDVRLRTYMSKAKTFQSSRLLLEEWSLEQAKLKSGSDVFLAVEAAPQVPAGARPIKVQLGKSVVFQGEPFMAYEIICPAGCKVRDVLGMAIAEIGVDPNEKWHLCTTNWNSDRGCVIDDVDSTLDEAHVPANDMLLLEMGDIVPRGFVDVQVSWCDLSEIDRASREKGIQDFASRIVKTWLGGALSLVRFPDLMLALGTDSAAALGLQTPADCIDSVDITRDQRILHIGTLRVRQKILPKELLKQIAEMPEVQAHCHVNPSATRYDSEVRIREIRESRLGKVIVPFSPPSGGPNAQLHTTQRLCIELGKEEKPPAGYNPKTMAPPILLHVARRHRAKRSYHPPRPFTYWPPHTADSLQRQLSFFLEIAENRIRACRFVRKHHSWDQLVPVIAVTVQQKKKGRPKGGSKKANRANKTKVSQPRSNLKNVVKHGDVIGVDVLDDEWADMTCAADRAQELQDLWIAEQRRVARLMGGRHDWAGASSGSGSKRSEPVLKIAVPDFAEQDENELIDSGGSSSDET